MEIVISQEKGSRPVTVYHITGEVNSSNHMDLEKQFRTDCDAGMRDLLIDLKDCDYVSSAGIRVLNTMVKSLQTDRPEESNEAMNRGIADGTWHSPHLKLVNVSKRVQDVLRIAGVDMLLEMHKTMKAALASF